MKQYCKFVGMTHIAGPCTITEIEITNVSNWHNMADLDAFLAQHNWLPFVPAAFDGEILASHIVPQGGNAVQVVDYGITTAELDQRKAAARQAMIQAYRAAGAREYGLALRDLFPDLTPPAETNREVTTAAVAAKLDAAATAAEQAGQALAHSIILKHASKLQFLFTSLCHATGHDNTWWLFENYPEILA